MAIRNLTGSPRLGVLYDLSKSFALCGFLGFSLGHYPVQVISVFVVPRGKVIGKAMVPPKTLIEQVPTYPTSVTFRPDAPVGAAKTFTSTSESMVIGTGALFCPIRNVDGTPA